jgi:hypothetical protein
MGRFEGANAQFLLGKHTTWLDTPTLCVQIPVVTETITASRDHEMDETITPSTRTYGKPATSGIALTGDIDVKLNPLRTSYHRLRPLYAHLRHQQLAWRRVHA